ncbi:hypothetical protein EDB89DRAFT_1645345 [Lactarius sanguifluus]|nr:hypothetical protein EDB89DRAFT_1645345 [Lactarius sanguifluus]
MFSSGAVAFLYVLFGAFLSLAIAYLAAGPSAQLACTVLCPNMVLSPNTRRIHPSFLQDCRFRTTGVEKPTMSTAQYASGQLARRRSRTGWRLSHLCSCQRNRYTSNLFLAHQTLRLLCQPKRNQKTYPSIGYPGTARVDARVRVPEWTSLLSHHLSLVYMQVAVLSSLV